MSVRWSRWPRSRPRRVGSPPRSRSIMLRWASIGRLSSTAMASTRSPSQGSRPVSARSIRRRFNGCAPPSATPSGVDGWPGAGATSTVSRCWPRRRGPALPELERTSACPAISPPGSTPGRPAVPERADRSGTGSRSPAERAGVDMGGTRRPLRQVDGREGGRPHAGASRRGRRWERACRAGARAVVGRPGRSRGARPPRPDR